MNAELKLTDLINVDILQQLQDAFSEMTGMAALTTDKDGVAVTKGSNFTDFCMKYTRCTVKGNKRCNACDKMGAEQAMTEGTASVYTCHAGLVDFAAPIIANGRMVGSFIGGQVLTNPPDPAKFARIASDLGIDIGEYYDAACKVRIVDRETVDRSAKFLYTMAAILSNIAYNSYMLYLSNLEIEKIARAKSDFLANMSHEIRTPMNAALGMSEMALREEMSPAAREYIHQIRSASKSLLVIINDILDFSKIESGKMEITPVTYEPLSLINDIASIISTRIGSKNIEFIMDISPDMPHRLLGDNVRIQQIIMNLLTNAVKFTTQGQVVLKMECVPFGGDTVMMKVSVTDTGSGIKREDLNKLFRSFQQLDSKRNRNIEGTGLGLAICRQLLSLMNGDISVESEYNKGSCFSFVLPQQLVSESAMNIRRNNLPRTAVLINNGYLKKQVMIDLERIGIAATDMEEASSLSEYHDYLIVERTLYSDKISKFFNPGKEPVKCIIIDNFGSNFHDDTSEDVRIIRKPVYFLNLFAAMGLIPEYAHGETESEEDFAFTAPDANILIVDDNSVNLTVAKGLIAPLNMRVDTAMNAGETIEKVKGMMYDIIFMDHMMPEVDGVETTRIIRRLMPEYANVPIIALTANAIGGAREMFLREGMNDFLPKPMDAKDIISMVRKWLPSEKLIPINKDEAEASEKENKENAPLRIEGLNIESAVNLLGSESLYMAVLKEYYMTIEKKSAVIEDYFKNELWSEYTIEVHSLKSTSRQIGADDLATMAAELEKAGKEQNTEFIKAKHGAMLKMYKDYKRILSPVFPDSEVKEIHRAADPVEIMDMLDELKEALENFDTLMIDDVIEKMNGFVYDNVFGEFFTNLKNAAEDCDIDTCTAIADEWKKDIADLYINR
ncbi:MAG: PocR ligand-binding domain-containing protein [Oscillospiraceae bacterium]|nr:PocR ligand-binding domain-containing protein [Oscillospiraceae bacterium]